MVIDDVGLLCVFVCGRLVGWVNGYFYLNDYDSLHISVYVYCLAD